MRAIWWLVPPLLPLLAGGCAIPPAVTIASFAADGVSYAATGKSVTDHGISAATGHDCALLRPVIDDKPVCDTTLSPRAKSVPVVEGTAETAQPAPAATPPPVARDRYVTVGSFLDPANARRAAASYAPLQASLVPVEVRGRRFLRVVVGPLSGDEAASLKLRLAAN